MMAYCFNSFVEDGTEYWSEGNWYEIKSEDDDGFEMSHNYGIGFIYKEDFDDYFKRKEG